MNRINLTQTGGFPLETDTLNFMQSSFSQLAALTGLGGKDYILSGCEVNGANVANGTVVINGEILPFIGGAKQQFIIVEETSENRTFEDGQSKPVFFTRVAKFANGGVMTFDSMIRVSNLIDINNRILKQEVVKWTPSLIGPDLGTITAHDCYMYRMGKQVTLYGNIMYSWDSEGSSIGSVGIKGFPVLNGAGNQYGFCNTGAQAFAVDIRYIEYEPPSSLNGELISFRAMFSKAVYNFKFSINIITQ